MRVLMFGRGTIATLYGQAFEDAGHDVTFAVRAGRVSELSTVDVDVIDARRFPLGRRTRRLFSPRVTEISELSDDFDLIVLSVGHHRLREAAAALDSHVGDATVLIFGNVWEEPVDTIAPLPPKQVLFGFPGAGGGLDSDGVLRGALFRSVTLGVADENALAREQVVREAFEQAGFTVKMESDMRGWLWLHFVSDAGMFSQGLHSGGLANMIGDRRALREAFRRSRELLPVLEARGVDLRRHRGTTFPARLPSLAAAASACATALLPIARVSLAAHTDPNAAEARAVLVDTLETAQRLKIATPRLEQAAKAN